MISEQEIVRELSSILMKTTSTEKHRGYHILPERVDLKIKDERLRSKPKFYEKERMTYIRSKVEFRNKSILDIGCNVGYFLFGALDDGATSVTGYEGKVLCNEFVENAVKLLGEENRFRLFREYFDFSTQSEKYDVVILLNVLHHVGADYGDESLTMDEAKVKIIEQINSLSESTSILIYQMGFNWQGNIKTCLFEHGTKGEMIDYLKEGTKNHWETLAIGVPERHDGRVVYKDLDEKNISRDDSLGEFLNRPLFILKSKKFEKS